MVGVFKKDDLVLVYSLQSFRCGGFINGELGRVAQDQIGGSVLVAVARNIHGTMQIDPYYEVYPEQLRRVGRAARRKDAWTTSESS